MKKQTVKVLILFLIVVTILVGVSFVSAFLKRLPKNPPETVGNTAGNINNNGLFCETADKIYFANAYDDGCLYVMDKDGSHMKKLSATSASLINVGGDYLYYYQKSVDGNSGLGYVRSTHGLCRMRNDGTHISGMNRNVIFSMQLIGNDIFYLSSNEYGPLFYQVSTDGKTETLLAQFSINPACVSDGLIYYNGTLDNHYLYAFNPKTGTSQEVWQGNLWYPILDGNYVYYMDVANNYRLCRYDRFEDSIEVLTEDRVDCYNLGGSYIYYQKNSETEPALMRMRYDGSEPELIAKGNFTSINVTGDYVYFQSFASPVPMYRTPTAGAVNVTTFDAAMDAVLEK